MEQKFLEPDKRRGIFIIVAIILLLLILFLLLAFHKKQYEITFDSNGGSEIASVKVKENDKIEQPDDPIREGYIFAGWYYLNELYDFNMPVKSNMTLKAEWAVLGSAEVEGITLNVTDLTLASDETEVLIATLLPQNAESVKLVWTSSDESIATVDENGNVKALKEGVVTITVATEDGNYTASCTVTITAEEDSNTNNNNNNSNPNTPNTPSTPTNPSNPSTPVQPSKPDEPSQPEEQNKPTEVSPTGVTISGPTSVEVGKTIQLTATVLPENATNKSVTWNSSNPSVATVDGNGKVTGVSAGSVTITVTTSNGISKTYTVTVTEKPEPPKEDTYEIIFTRVRQEGTNNVMQYTFVVRKNGASFTAFKGFECGGVQARGGNAYVSLKSESSSAKITLNDGSVVTATAKYQG